MTDEEIRKAFYEEFPVSVLPNGDEEPFFADQLDTPERVLDFILSTVHSEREALREGIEDKKKSPTEDQEDSLEYDEGYDAAIDDVLALLDKE